MVEQGVGAERADDVDLAAPGRRHGRSDGGLLFGAHFAALARVRVQAADGDTRARQAEVATGLRGQLDHHLDLGLRQVVGDELDRQMRRRQRDAQPAAAVVLAEQHHRRAVGAGELGEQLRLADEGLAGAHDRLLVHRRGHQRIELVAQTALRAFPHPGDRRARRGGRAFQQVRRQSVRQRLAQEEPPGLVLAGVGLQGELQPELLVEAARVLRVADQQVARVVGAVHVVDGVDQVVQDEGLPLDRPALDGVFHQLDREVVAFLVVVDLLVEPGPVSIAEHREEENADGDNGCDGNDRGLSLQEQSAEQEGRTDQDGPHGEQDVAGAHPGDEEKARGEGPDDGAQGGESVDLAHDVSRPVQVVQGELHHDGRDHAEKHRGNEEDGRREQQDPQHQSRLELGGADQIGQGCDGQGPHAGKEEQPPQGSLAGIPVREGPADPGADADPRKDDADDARPRVQGDPHIGRHDPSRHEFDDERAETGDENDHVGLDDNRVHKYLERCSARAFGILCALFTIDQPYRGYRVSGLGYREGSRFRL